MYCPSCSRDNREGRKFCADCGAALPLACGSCGALNEEGEKFCGECGGALVPGTARQPAGAIARSAPARTESEARKVVTIVFADLAGSTALHERLDAESVRRLMDRYYETLRSVIDMHGGTVIKLLGDGVMAAFGLRRAAEDDAVRAVRAAVAMQDAFRELAGVQAALDTAGLRIGINTGEVVVSGAEDDVIGDPVNIAARLQEQGRDGDVVIGEATRRLVATRVTLAPLGSVRLKGRAEAVAAYRVESLDAPANVTVAPFVGRENELARLQAVYEEAVAAPSARLAVVLGSPGLGKSRLVEEIVRQLGEAATVLIAPCDAAGRSTFAPIAMALRASLGIEVDAATEAQRDAIQAALGDDPDRSRIADGIVALLAGSPASPEETFFVVRRLLAALARRRPVVLVIDDVHWAEPLLLDLIEHLVQWGSGVPLFVLAGARPELRELRSSLVAPGELIREVVTLGGLDAGAAMRLAANAIGASDLPAAVAAKVLATSEGNPLFVGELVRMLVQEGALTKEGDRWVVGPGLATIEMPPTIHALLAARIEQLGSEERTVLERAAVVGRRFSRAAVAALLGRDGNQLDGRLESLRRSELIERDTGWLLGEPVLRFHHVLIRDAAYRRLLKGTRAELHERLADWIEAQVGDAIEHDETIGWHLEQAHQHLRELAPVDAHGRMLGERAATRLAAAGRRALARDDVPLAAGLLGRALARIEAGAPARAELALDWCEALLSAGDVVGAAVAIDELEHISESSPRLQAWHTCFASQLVVMTAPEELRAAADRVAAAARELTAQGDPAGEAKAHFVHANALARLGKVGACESALDEALAAARRAGDRRRANAVLAGAPLAALWGPRPVTRASGRCLDVVRVLRITQGAPAVEAVALYCQGLLEALRGRTDAARRMLASSRAMVEELGLSQRLFEVDAFIARIDLLEGNAAAAEQRLRPTYDGLRDLGLGIDAALAAALLARALLAQGRAAEAERLSHESEMLAGDDLQAAIAWRGVRAQALAARGEHAAAVELAKAAVAIAAATDALLDHADARVALAAALRAAGRGAEGDAEERLAIELWHTKGATLLSARTRTFAGDRAAVASVEPEAEPPSRSDMLTTAATAAATPACARVRTNMAVAAFAAAVDAFARRDIDAIGAVASEAYEEVDHPTGSTWGREEAITSMALLLRSPDARFDVEPLAVLGERLMLGRRRIHASAAGHKLFDVGEYENETLVVMAVDERGLCWRVEVFARDRLRAATVRLFERYAESLPEGHARTRARGSARTLFLLDGCIDADRIAPGLAASFSALDHRSLGMWSTRSREQFLTHCRVQSSLTVEWTGRDDDVLALEPGATLGRQTFFGTDRGGGGTVENVMLSLSVFDGSGLLSRLELFEPACEAEALARFDELIAEERDVPPSHFDAPTAATTEAAAAVQARVRPNMAVAAIAAVDAAFARGDLEAMSAALGAAYEEIDHPTASTYGRQETITSLAMLLRSSDPSYRVQPLAVLGERLMLGRRRIHASGAGHKTFDVGEYENEAIVVLEVDEKGLCRRFEVFASDHLRAALARLFDLYAESLPEGPERTRARGTAGSLFLLDGSLDADRIVGGMAVSFVSIDHRSLGTWATQTREQWLMHCRVQSTLVADWIGRDIDVIALTPDAIVVRQIYCGSDRRGGGNFENVILMLLVFDTSGLVPRLEVFEPTAEAEALARFDEVTGAAPVTVKVVSSSGGLTDVPLPHRFANNASVVPIGAALIAHDWESFAQQLAPDFRMFDRRRVVQLEFSRDEFLAFARDITEGRTVRNRSELLATRGEHLALIRDTFEFADGDVGSSEVASLIPGVGPSELAFLSLLEADDNHRITRFARWDVEDLDAAYAELDRWFEERSTAQCMRAWAAIHTVRDAVNARDWAAFIARFRPGYAGHDHRRLQFGSLLSDPAVYVRSQQVLVELAPDVRTQVSHARVADRGTMVEIHVIGTRDGGAFETLYLWVNEVDQEGATTRFDLYELEQIDMARARFAELIAPQAPPPHRFANMASGAEAPVIAALIAHDWERLVLQFSPDFRMLERRRVVQLEFNRDEYVAFARGIAGRRMVHHGSELLATRGEHLALLRGTFEFADAHAESGDATFLIPDVGRSDLEFLSLFEAEDNARITRITRWDVEDLDAAYAELDRSFEARSNGRCKLACAANQATVDTRNAHDLEALLACFTPGYVGHDHRPLHWGSMLSDPAVFARSQRLLIEMAPDVRVHVSHVRIADRGALTEAKEMGTRDGGAFESPYLAVCEVNEEGRIPRFDLYDVEQIEMARARFAELGGGSMPPQT